MNENIVDGLNKDILRDVVCERFYKQYESEPVFHNAITHLITQRKIGEYEVAYCLSALSNMVVELEKSCVEQINKHTEQIFKLK